MGDSLFYIYTMLKVQNIHKKYPGEHYGAVVDISFELREKEILAIVGRSGSGKSTLLRMIAGLMKPDSGLISFNKRPLENPEEQLIAGHEKIKMVFQDFQVKPNMTVAENIKYKLLQFNKDYQEERCLELLELCGISSLASKKPHELSGGQKQRLSLARALADEPELLLMDEPFSNLDPIIKEDLLIELTEIVRQEEISLILVSHDVRDAMLIADQIAYIENGVLIQKGSPVKIYKEPLNLAIAQFFGRINEISSLVDSPCTFIRAEDIMINETHWKHLAKVDACKFLGDRYLIRSSIQNQKDFTFYSNTHITVGSMVKIQFNESCELHFPGCS